MSFDYMTYPMQVMQSISLCVCLCNSPHSPLPGTARIRENVVTCSGKFPFAACLEGCTEEDWLLAPSLQTNTAIKHNGQGLLVGTLHFICRLGIADVGVGHLAALS